MKNKMVPQNIMVKLEMRFSYNEKHFVRMRFWIKHFIFLRLTTERDNLILLYGWSMPYTWSPYQLTIYYPAYICCPDETLDTIWTYHVCLLNLALIWISLVYNFLHEINMFVTLMLYLTSALQESPKRRYKIELIF